MSGSLPVTWLAGNHVKHNAAHYDPTTGEWGWRERGMK
jgi:hypothetical protein